MLVAAVVALLVGSGLAPSPAAADQMGGHTVRSESFDGSWKFALANTSGDDDPAYADADEPGFDDSSWRTLNLPHDWSIEQPMTPAAGSGTGYFPGGLGWYRKTFTLPRSTAGQDVSLEFDGVYMDSEVYLNGTLVTAHPYGYTGFAVDLTAAHRDGRTPNVVAVKVRNKLPSSRWYSGSGINRHVDLVVTDRVHVARHGTFVTTPDVEREVESGYATAHVRTDVVNGRGAEDIAVQYRIKDPNGRVVARHRVATGTTVESDIRVPAPKLWSMAHPHLYTLETEVTVAGRRVDATSTRFGFRWVRFDANEGFFVNGEYHKIQGVDLHHDQGALGSAVHRDALARQLKLMKGMGVNAFRTSHNPPSPEQVELCEELGIVMMVEAFDTWRRPKIAYDYGRFFDANSTADIKEMVHAAKNSPAVVLWSVGNEIPDFWNVPFGPDTAKRLAADIRSIDTSRPIVFGSDAYRRVPATGSGPDQILNALDGLGLNYNTAGAVDALHAKYPDKFIFESESSSSTSTRGSYQDPSLVNTGENHTPGKREVSSYDNNMASWTLSGEYGLKKDRDRKFFLGQFLWAGMDYIGEPTPYDGVFPVRTSHFGAMDTAGFPKDLYYLFKSQWTTDPMVHVVPMDWTDHEVGEPVQVWAYANVDTVELFLNGTSLGVRKFDRKKTTYGKEYLETTEPSNDDKNVTTGPFPGSYTSPNGSAGKLHLTWTVPFQPGELVAVARKDGREVARDAVRTAGAAAAVELTPDRETVTADGRSLTYVTADVVDRNGVVVPGAADHVTFSVTGGKLVGVDNGRPESVEPYKADGMTAFHGKVLAIVQSDSRGGPVTIKATAPGLRSGHASVLAVRRGDRGPGGLTPVGSAPPLPDGPAVDASYSGRATTLPAAMVDGDLTTRWSNSYAKQATQVLPAVSSAHASDWVSVAWPQAREVRGVTSHFTVDGAHQLPASVRVAYWDGAAWVPASNVRVDWATAAGGPSGITFDPVTTTRVRITMTSRAPGTSTGFLGIDELQVVGGP
ncbi:glycoside hydrolase family 2 TIM barrel-domain containing protein [Saccharothrix sp. NRRL B-16348]|uniref:glycoside hydrolase family 2 TIM barrel-domain containing protein n=1 Tax=Saccharothrix sp. NRRL B-16348 TaxID=1415542 RepID=UPI001E29D172|nr:glycoside hydrolase family 2 TIM barrel-domain containing protein [Saccharothrix sp. NRRL B-16348]